MRTQGTSSATFLMLFVLGVTGVIGVFGLPQFEPVVASSDPVEHDQWSDDIDSYREAGAGESIAQGVEDLFGPNENSTEVASADVGSDVPALPLDPLEDQAANEQHIVSLIGESTEIATAAGAEVFAPVAFADNENKDLPFGESLQQEPTASGSPNGEGTADRAKFDSRFGRNRIDQPAVAHANVAFPNAKPVLLDEAKIARTTQPSSLGQEPLSWRAAVARLNSLGIRKYRLTPGSEPNEFHFSCFFSPTDSPRVTHRFEAEASEPLQAVQKVLAQVDQWRSVR